MSMEEANIGKRRICNRDEELSPPFGTAGEERVIVCCFLDLKFSHDFGVYAADIRGGRLEKICRLHIDGPPRISGCSYGAVGSKIYRIGGDMSDEEKLYPRDVFYCDLFYKNDTICCTNWERGPSLIAGMPNALVVTVNNKIYALAGDIRESTGEKLYRNCLFQVLDPFEQPPSWKPLPAPPFFCFSFQPEISCVLVVAFRTVVGDIIFLRVEQPSDCPRPEPVNYYGFWKEYYLFSFDTKANIWKSHGISTDSSSSSSSSALPPSLSSLLSKLKLDLDNNIVSSSDSSSSHDESFDEYHLDDLIVDNLRVRNWLPGKADPPIENKLYFCISHLWREGTKVFAHDLAYKREDYMVKDEDEDEDEDEEEDYDCCYGDYYPFYTCKIAPLPVRGLANVTNLIRGAYDNLITHIGRNKFLLIVVAPGNGCSMIMHLCTFKVSDEEELEGKVPDEEPQVLPGSSCLYAKDVDYRIHELDSDIARLGNFWCKLHDLGYPLDSSPFKKCA